MKSLILTLFISCCYLIGFTQNFKKVKPYTFMLGVNWNIMDDDGYRTEHLFDVKNSWNILPFPTSINADIYFQKGMSIDIMASYNEYKAEKLINFDSENDTIKMGKAGALDVHFKYSFGFLMKQQVFDPFVYAGIGYTGREATSPQSSFNGNVGAGFNVMLIGGIGIQWRTTGKIALLPEVFSEEFDYLHHHFGIIYKFGMAPRLNGDFNKRKFKWTHKKHRYRKKGM